MRAMDIGQPVATKLNTTNWRDAKGVIVAFHIALQDQAAGMTGRTDI